jgi:hypothetical protein
VTTAVSGANPSTCSASFLRKLSGMNSGKYAFSCPVSLNMVSSCCCILSQMPYPRGRITMQPRTGE